MFLGCPFAVSGIHDGRCAHSVWVRSECYHIRMTSRSHFLSSIPPHVASKKLVQMIYTSKTSCSMYAFAYSIRGLRMSEAVGSALADALLHDWYFFFARPPRHAILSTGRGQICANLMKWLKETCHIPFQNHSVWSCSKLIVGQMCIYLQVARRVRFNKNS